MDIKQYTEAWKSLIKVSGADACGADVFRLDRETLERAGYHDGMSMLDYGCGWGSVLTQVNPGEYVGVDVSPLILAEARKRFPDRDFEECEIGWVPVSPKDIVVSHSVFTHIQKEFLDLCILDVTRNIKPGGFAVVDIYSKEIDDFSPGYSEEEWQGRWAKHGYRADFMGTRVRSEGFIHSYYKIWR